jgi:hypothetical protein
MVKPKVFVSYRRNDGEDVALYLAERLRKLGIDVFLDIHNLQAGQDFSVELQTAITNADYFLLILSPVTLESEWVRKETQLALQLKKSIIPIPIKQFDFYKHVLPSELEAIKSFQAIPYDFQRADNCVQRLQAAIKPSVKSRPRAYGVAIGSLIVAIGLAFVVFSLNKGAEAIATATASTNISITGDNNYVINESDIGNLTIVQGDSPEEQERKRRQIASLISQEMMQYVLSLDGRMAIADVAVRNGSLDDPLQEARQTLVPSASDQLGNSYQSLMAQEQANSIVQGFNSYPLPNIANDATLQLAAELDIELALLENAYSGLIEAKTQSERLVDRVQAFADETWDDAFLQDRLNVQMQIFTNRGNIAYLNILLVLQELQEDFPDLPINLASLEYLEPDSLPETLNETYELLADEIHEGELLVQEQERLIEDGNAQVLDLVAEYDELYESLMLAENDDSDMVIAKAITMRQFGLIDESIAAFQEYERRFSPDDETASQYAETAQAFTLQIDSLNIIDGAVYIYGIAPNSSAEDVGLEVGDILIEFGGVPIHNVCDMVALGFNVTPDSLERCELSSAPSIDEGVTMSFTYLRLEADGSFSRHSGIVTKQDGLFGFGIMPI